MPLEQAKKRLTGLITLLDTEITTAEMYASAIGGVTGFAFGQNDVILKGLKEKAAVLSSVHTKLNKFISNDQTSNILPSPIVGLIQILDLSLSSAQAYPLIRKEIYSCISLAILEDLALTYDDLAKLKGFRFSDPIAQETLRKIEEDFNKKEVNLDAKIKLITDEQSKLGEMRQELNRKQAEFATHQKQYDANLKSLKVSTKELEEQSNSLDAKALEISAKNIAIKEYDTVVRPHLKKWEAILTIKCVVEEKEFRPLIEAELHKSAERRKELDGKLKQEFFVTSYDELLALKKEYSCAQQKSTAADPISIRTRTVMQEDDYVSYSGKITYNERVIAKSFADTQAGNIGRAQGKHDMSRLEKAYPKIFNLNNDAEIMNIANEYKALNKTKEECETQLKNKLSTPAHTFTSEIQSLDRDASYLADPVLRLTNANKLLSNLENHYYMDRAEVLNVATVDSKEIQTTISRPNPPKIKVKTQDYFKSRSVLYSAEKSIQCTTENQSRDSQQVNSMQ